MYGEGRADRATRNALNRLRAASAVPSNASTRSYQGGCRDGRGQAKRLASASSDGRPCSPERPPGYRCEKRHPGGPHEHPPGNQRGSGGLRRTPSFWRLIHASRPDRGATRASVGPSRDVRRRGDGAPLTSCRSTTTSRRRRRGSATPGRRRAARRGGAREPAGTRPAASAMTPAMICPR